MTDLNKFCADDSDYRPYIRHPFMIGKYCVRTDGHTLTIINGGHSDDCADTQTGVAEKSKENINILENISKWQPLPELNKKAFVCRSCDGKPKEQKECKECKGEGELELDSGFNEYEVECKSCEGFGVEYNSCSCCKNASELPAYNPAMAFNDFYVNPNYVFRIVETFTDVEFSISGHQAYFKFKNDDLDGFAVVLSLREAKSYINVLADCAPT